MKRDMTRKRLAYRLRTFSRAQRGSFLGFFFKVSLGELLFAKKLLALSYWALSLFFGLLFLCRDRLFLQCSRQI